LPLICGFIASLTARIVFAPLSGVTPPTAAAAVEISARVTNAEAGNPPTVSASAAFIA
jgi:hypothetical protein